MSLLALTMLFIHLKASTHTHTLQPRTSEGLAGSSEPSWTGPETRGAALIPAKIFGTNISGHFQALSDLLGTSQSLSEHWQGQTIY